MARHMPFKLVLSLGCLPSPGAMSLPPPRRPKTAGDQPLAAASLFPGWLARATLPEQYSRSDLSAGVIDDAAGQSTVYILGGRFKQPPSDPPATTILAYKVGATDVLTTRRPTSLARQRTGWARSAVCCTSQVDGTSPGPRTTGWTYQRGCWRTIRFPIAC